mmetsp:Transcript_18836/g.31531  ORF Transcript_18836/g.31531 Transcript_18836/m.31531 type:complete len:402 (-) Transcript_18836:193-1398(-)
MTSLENAEKVRDEIKQSVFTNMLMMAHCCLKSFPSQLLANEESLTRLRRLDLSHNYILEIPSSISLLVGLKELWLQHNPIDKFPDGVCALTNLELIDINSTNIAELPTELAYLDKIYEFDWRSTPLSKNLQSKHQIETNDVLSLRKLLKNQHTRKLLEAHLFEFLKDEHFIMDADMPGIKSRISFLVKDISNMFEDLEEMRQYVRRAGKLLPGRIDDVTTSTPEESRQLLNEFRRDTDRSRLAADVEIKLRGMYFDRIERKEVTSLLYSIYDHVASLEDMQFLVQYAPQVLPPEPHDATGEVIWKNILDLQHDLTSKREASVSALAGAMGQLYPEQQPVHVKERAQDVAKFFQTERFATKKELTKMSQLTAECAKVFPPDFVSVDPTEVIKQAQIIIFARG